MNAHLNQMLIEEYIHSTQPIKEIAFMKDKCHGKKKYKKKMNKGCKKIQQVIFKALIRIISSLTLHLLSITQIIKEVLQMDFSLSKKYLRHFYLS